MPGREHNNNKQSYLLGILIRKSCTFNHKAFKSSTYSFSFSFFVIIEKNIAKKTLTKTTTKLANSLKNQGHIPLSTDKCTADTHKMQRIRKIVPQQLVKKKRLNYFFSEFTFIFSSLSLLDRQK